jgi:hypothetical protein
MAVGERFEADAVAFEHGWFEHYHRTAMLPGR